MSPQFVAQADEAGAEFAETEKRLKRAGVDPALRAQIHTAIRRAADHLLATQDAEGIWGLGAASRAGMDAHVRQRSRARVYRAAASTFASLALAHSQDARYTAAAQRAGRRLFLHHDAELRDNTYTVGLALLLADAVDEAATRRRLQAWLERPARMDGGYWNYGPGGHLSGGGNLSTSQFAALGLWTAIRNGPSSKSPLMRHHLDALLHHQGPDGSWPYGPSFRNWRSSYPNGAYMGIADLMIARQLFKVEAGEQDAGVAIEYARARGLCAMRRYAPLTLRGFARQGETVWPYYNIFALEKACVFTAVERLGSFPWYVQGARRLLESQLPTGAWTSASWAPRALAVSQGGGSPSLKPYIDVMDTATGLLFLLRLSEAHPPSAALTEPATPEITGTQQAGPDGMARPPVHRIREARDVLRRPDLPWATGRRLIERLGDRYDAAGGEEGAGEVERLAIEEVLLEVLRSAWAADGKGYKMRHLLGADAARVLARTHRRVTHDVFAILDRHAHPVGTRVLPVALLEATLDILPPFADEAILDWLVDRSVARAVDEANWVRVTTYLCILREFGSLPLEARRKAARKICANHASLERAGRANATRDTAQFFGSLDVELAHCCLCLLRGSTHGPELLTPDGRELVSIQDVRAYLIE